MRNFLFRSASYSAVPHDKAVKIGAGSTVRLGRRQDAELSRYTDLEAEDGRNNRVGKENTQRQ